MNRVSAALSIQVSLLRIEKDTDIFELFGAPVHAAVGQLSLRKPPPERRHVDDVQTI